MPYRPNINFIIADDDKEDQELLLQAFCEGGFKFDSVSVYNGGQLMDYLLCRKSYQDDSHADPDFIVLDINMPGKNGFEVLRELKGHGKLQNIPVYIFSTTISSNDQKIMTRLGARKCYTKPILFSDYKKIISEILAS